MSENCAQNEQRLLQDDYRLMAADMERNAPDWCEASASDGVLAAEADYPHTA